MKSTAILLAGTLAVAACTSAPEPGSGNAGARIDSVLTAFHDAAGRGDYEAYFALFAPEAVFLGTDDWERWERPAFEAYARPRFERGGWKYASTERHVFVADDGRTAWFDEMLQNASMGTTRGSGVLVRVDGDWRIAQYNLSMPIPNEIADSVVAQIRAFDAAAADTTAGS